MSEIEKMYRTIFGEFAPNCSLCVKLVECNIFDNTHNCNKFEGDYKSLFTAEKQLLLLQYIEKLDWIDAVVSFYYMNEEWVFLAQPITEFSNEQMRDFGGKQKEYEQALAQMINTLWQDLSEEEKQQIKEILE